MVFWNPKFFAICHQKIFPFHKALQAVWELSYLPFGANCLRVSYLQGTGFHLTNRSQFYSKNWSKRRKNSSTVFWGKEKWSRGLWLLSQRSILLKNGFRILIPSIVLIKILDLKSTVQIPFSLTTYNNKSEMHFWQVQQPNNQFPSSLFNLCPP